MGNTYHALDPPARPADGWPAMVVIFGDEPFLQTLMLRHVIAPPSGQSDSGESAPSGPVSDLSNFSVDRFEGDEVEWRDVSDSLSSQSLFSQGGTMVIVEDADGFVKKCREDLEAYVRRSPSGSTLLLRVKQWPGNTRLYKMVDQQGIQIRCSVPEKGTGWSKQRDSKTIGAWMVRWAKSEHGLSIAQRLANMLMEWLNDDFGRADQELAKLALFVEGNKPVTEELLHQVVAGSRLREIWDAADAAADGEAITAVRLLGRLIESGEHQLALLGPLSWCLRRYGQVYETITAAERKGEKPDWDQAIVQAGFQRGPSKTQQTKKQLKQLGRTRVRRMLRWLADTDLALKRTHSDDTRARLALEKLLVRLARDLGPLAPSQPSSK